MIFLNISPLPVTPTIYERLLLHLILHLNVSPQCIPISGLGFRRGSYRCMCKRGFYFPNTDLETKWYNGSVLEDEYEKKLMVTFVSKLRRNNVIFLSGSQYDFV